MVLGILAVLLSAAVVFIFNVFGMFAAGPQRGGVGGVIVTVTSYAILLAFALLMIVFQTALILLLVDAARNLRKLVAHSR
jgi:hypothetical protein